MLCRSTYCYLQNIGKIRKYLDVSTARIATHALVTSKLDYLNGLQHGLPACQLAKLQRVQNTAARIVSRVIPSPFFAHWLPVKYRVQFKVLTLTYKAMHNEGQFAQRNSYGLRCPCPGRSLLRCCPHIVEHYSTCSSPGSLDGCLQEQLKSYLFTRAFYIKLAGTLLISTF